MSVWSLEKLREYLVEQGIISLYPWNGCGSCWVGADYIGVIRKPGKTMTILNSDLNTGLLAEFIKNVPKVEDGFVVLSGRLHEHGIHICAKLTNWKRYRD